MLTIATFALYDYMIQSTSSITCYLQLKCPTVRWFLAYMRVSAATYQGYSLRLRFYYEYVYVDVFEL